MTTKEKISVYEIVTNQIVEMLDQGIIPWKQMWRTGVPQNMVTRRPYEGINAMMLAITQDMRGYSTPYWLTMKQCNDQGGKIRKGEKSTIVTFWKKTVKDEKKKPEGDNVFFLLRYYRVFNLDQCEGVEAPEGGVTQPIDKIEACEKIVDGYKDAPPVRWEGDRACYSPKTDTVFMPPRNKFHSPESVYATLFHEFGHSTGHANRLEREGITDESSRFGTDLYSKEELIAEFCAAFLCGMTGIMPSTVENHASYIQGWSKKFKEDKRMIMAAAGKAQKAANWILGTIPDPFVSNTVMETAQ